MCLLALSRLDQIGSAAQLHVTLKTAGLHAPFRHQHSVIDLSAALTENCAHLAHALRHIISCAATCRRRRLLCDCCVCLCLCILPQLLSDAHGAELGATHGAEVGGLWTGVSETRGDTRSSNEGTQTLAETLERLAAGSRLGSEKSSGSDQCQPKGQCTVRPPPSRTFAGSWGRVASWKARAVTGSRDRLN